jgi:hypothetical protein
MKNKTSFLLFFLLLLSVCASAIAVPDTILPNKKNTSYITLMNGSTLDGYIVYVSDSTIQFMDKHDYYRSGSISSRTIAAEDILDIKKRFRKGIKTGAAILGGFGVGAVLGFGLGLSHDCTKPDGSRCDFADRLFATKNFGAALLLGGLLGTVGALLGIFSPKKTKASFSINGKKENIRGNKNGLMFY